MKSKRYVKLISLIIFISIIGILSGSVFGVSNIFSFDSSKVFNANEPISGKVITDTKVTLYLNGQEISSQTFKSSGKKTIYWNTRPSSLVLNFSSNLTIYNDYGKNIFLQTPFGNKTLLSGTGATFDVNKVGSYVIRDNYSNIVSVDVVRPLVDFEFSNLNYKDGKNDVRFVVQDLSNGSTYKFSYNITVNKYPVTISIINYTKPVNMFTKFFVINGSLTENNLKILYLINQDFNNNVDIGSYFTTGINMSGNTFSIKFPVTYLHNGNNSVTIVAVPKGVNNYYNQYAKGVKVLKFKADFTPPTISITDPRFKLFTADPNLVFNVTTDASFLNYTFNGRNYSTTVTNGTAVVSLNLVRGKNNLTLIAIDDFGNIYKVAHAIMFDDRPPKIVNISPNDVFEKGISHQQIVSIWGKTNMPDVEVKMFAIPDDSPYTCKDYKDYFFRNISEYGSDTEQNQVSVDLGLITGHILTFTSDDEGNFGSHNSFDLSHLLLLSFPTKSLGSETSSNSHSREVGSVSSKVTVCAVMKSRYGKTNYQTYSVTFDAGNTMWRPSDVETTPNTVYASEIEQGNSVKYGENTGFSVFLQLHYEGDGEVNSITSVSVAKDDDYGDNKYLSINPDVRYYYDKDKKVLYVYFENDILPRHIKDLEKYPSKLNFGYRLYITYTVDSANIPVDTINPVYFQAQLDVERPLDHTKWLSPHTIEKVLKFLNKSIKITQKLVDYSKIGSLVGIGACLGYKMYLGIMGGVSGKLSNSDLESLYRICDRIYCLPSPPKCYNNKANTINFGTGNSVVPTEQQSLIKDDKGNVIAKITKVSKTNQQCTVGLGQNGEGQKGRIVEFNIAKTEKLGAVQHNLFGYVTTYQKYEGDVCVPVGKDGKINSINLNDYSGACYHSGPPFFDETKCWLPIYGPEGLAGMDSDKSLFHSLACGCITGTYKHLSKWLVYQEAMKKCLEQARMGQVEGSYCERLLGMAVCDVATSVVTFAFDYYGNDLQHGSRMNPNRDYTKYFRTINEMMKERYGNNALARKTMDTTMIANKMCVAAITGDWSSLMEDLTTALKETQVEPTFGPPMPVSRIIGYDPITGSLRIQYRFTYAVLSGGQDIHTDVSLVCDRNAVGGEYCPSTNVEKDVRSLDVPKDGSSQETIVLNDDNAKYWYNVLVLKHTYEVNGKVEHTTQRVNILHKGEVPFECHFSGGLMGAGAGFTCKSIFGGNNPIASLYSILDGSKFMPSSKYGNTAVYFPGNNIYFLLNYQLLSANTHPINTNQVALFNISCHYNDGSTYSTVIRKKFTLSGPREGYKPLVVWKKISFTKEENSYKAVYKFHPSNKGFILNKNYALCLVNLGDNGNDIYISDSNGHSYNFAIKKDENYCYNVGKVTQDFYITTNKEIPSTTDIVLINASRLNLNVGNGDYFSTSEIRNLDKKNYYFSYEKKLYTTPTGTLIGLKPGTCDVTVIPGLPDIDSYNTNSINNLKNNSQYITNVNIKTYKATIEFVNPNPSDGEKFYWDFMEPINGNNYCYSNLKGVKLAYISSSNSYADKEVNYKLYMKDPETDTYICIGGDCSNTGKSNAKLSMKGDFYTISPDSSGGIFSNINTDGLTGKYRGKSIEEILNMLSKGGSNIPMVGTAAQSSIQLKLVVKIWKKSSNKNKNISQTHTVEFLVSKCVYSENNNKPNNKPGKPNNGNEQGNGGGENQGKIYPKHD